MEELAQVHRPHWQRRASVFTAGYPAVRMRLWRHCLQGIFRLIRMFIVTIMVRGIIMEMDIVGKTNTAVQGMGADVDAGK